MKHYDRLLFIGDPHLIQLPYGLRMGRRVENDFALVTLNKLAQAMAWSRELNALPVITGDLFHRADESSLRLINRAIAIFREAYDIPYDMGGNHSARCGAVPTEDETLGLMFNSGALRPIPAAGTSQHLHLEVAGKKVRLACVPYGEAIPDKLAVGKDETGVLVTHHDLAFDGAYPGAAALKEVKGASLLVNGHMHRTMTPVTVGGTRCENPGNIIRLSVDCAEHRPAVWSWAPGDDGLTPHYLQVEDNVFDLDIATMPSVSTDEAVDGLTNNSRFAALMAASRPATAGGTELNALLGSIMAAAELSEPAQRLMEALMAEQQK